VLEKITGSHNYTQHMYVLLTIGFNSGVYGNASPEKAISSISLIPTFLMHVHDDYLGFMMR